jgi:hypothetical protein
VGASRARASPRISSSTALFGVVELEHTHYTIPWRWNIMGFFKFTCVPCGRRVASPSTVQWREIIQLKLSGRL